MSFPHRPELHFTADTGTLDSPAGVLYDSQSDSFHLFYQYQEDPQHAFRWGHQVAQTPYTWTSCDDVLDDDCHGGAAVQSGEEIQLFFTTERGIERASLPYSPTWGDYSEQLDPAVSRQGVVPGLEKHRSPCIYSNPNGGWYMLTVNDQSHIELFGSQNCVEWDFIGPMSFEGSVGIPLNDLLLSPRMIHLIDEIDQQGYDVLIATVGNTTGYIIGRIDATRFHVHTPFTRLDWGHDFISPRMNHDAARFGIGSMIFGLMKDPRPIPDASEHWSNCLSLPRALHLEEGVLYQVPASGLAKNINFSTQAHLWSAFFHGLSEGGKVIIDLLDENGDIGAQIRCDASSIVLDRSMNPLHGSEDKAAVAPIQADQLSIITDGSTVEVFANGGRTTLASRVFFHGGSCTEVRLHVEGGARVNHIAETGPKPF
ncbi:MAG: GH32 C-terminal domain-containing protein [Corynebacterium sp.]|nr:GH32 C-terminal domain-containing protein [Corynebacterium sp.]